MSTAADKAEATKNSVAASTTAATALPDRRPAAAVQRQLQANLASSPQLQQAATLQRAIDGSPRQQAAPAPLQKKENNTGLPDGLKAGVENLSGHSLDDVQVHYNSAKPAQLQAHAYAQGTDIHVAPGQEKHLPHEAWHVAQQKQGRVRPTMQLKGKVAVNDDAGLEREADVMGLKASEPVAQLTVRGKTPDTWAKSKSSKAKIQEKLLNFANEVHNDGLIYEAAELDSFYNESLKDKAHSDLKISELYEDFRHYVAKIRDADGAHGHERHAGTGDKFIADRVNNPNQPNYASYLLMDEYLKWDSVLKSAEEELYDSYLEAANDSIEEFSGYFSEQPISNVADGNVFLVDQENQVKDGKAVRASFGKQNWSLSVKAYIPRNALQVADGGNFTIKVGASVKGNQQLSAREVRKPAGQGNRASIQDVQAIQKTPEAHTGGLAPKFIIDAHANKESDPADGVTDLNWVTKY